MPEAKSLRLGAHMSIAGGLEKAVQRAHDASCDVVQIFTKNNNQWAAKPLTDAVIQAWRDALVQTGIGSPVAHASYLINLASPKEELFRKSIEALVVEWERAEQLQLEGLVVHPGAFTDSSEELGIAKIVDGVREIIDRVKPQHCRLLLENTAGQGSCLGHTIAQLGAMFRGIDNTENLGVCFDTCHAFAAGYDLTTDAGYAVMQTEIANELPPSVIRAVHINDSKKGCGSRVDRHDHIGQGMITLDGFRRVLADPVFNVCPMYLETPKGVDDETGEDFDVNNLNTLRGLVGGRA
ncbi:Endonuclease 4 [Rosistilla ulvae]|uniref:Probable endonuclease 4 n=1 Tax=Rosistilla ulvae TaxID=1930277 RepID=A0A517LYE1_9BACT|nr:deoxyribonuclease IV [Rosistilla ulvae]QDS87632.1 Endonuclease 4 [Rosistilla ulvae]